MSKCGCCNEAGHSCACAEFSFFDKVDCIFDRSTVWCNEKWFVRFLDDVHFRLDSRGKGQRFDFARRPFFAMVRQLY